MKVTIGTETFRTTQELVERIVTLDEGNGVLIDRIRELEAAIIREIMHQITEENRHQAAAEELTADDPYEASDHRHDAGMHSDFASRLQDILHPPHPPSDDPEIKF